jgi:superfamily I DNA/RNA helicase
LYFEVNLRSSKHIGREREVLLKSFKIVYVLKKTKRKEKRAERWVREFGVAVFLVKKN